MIDVTDNITRLHQVFRDWQSIYKSVHINPTVAIDSTFMLLIDGLIRPQEGYTLLDIIHHNTVSGYFYYQSSVISSNRYIT